MKEFKLFYICFFNAKLNEHFSNYYTFGGLSCKHSFKFILKYEIETELVFNRKY